MAQNDICKWKRMPHLEEMVEKGDLEPRSAIQNIASFGKHGLDRYQPALPVSRDIKGEAATAAAISIGSWFSGRLLKCVMKSEKGGNNPSRSSSGCLEPSGAVINAQNFSRVLAWGLNWSNHRNCPCSLISRNHHWPSLSTAKSTEPKQIFDFWANSRIPFSTSGGVGIISTVTLPSPASCRQSSVFLGLCSAKE